MPRRPAASAPAVEVEPRILDRRRDEAAEVGPLGQVGLAQDDGPARAAGGDQPRVARRPGCRPARASRPSSPCASRVAMLSLTRTGIPWRGPRTRPARRSASRRAAIAGASGLVSMTAWRTGSRRSIRTEVGRVSSALLSRSLGHRAPGAHRSRPRTMERPRPDPALASAARRWRHRSGPDRRPGPPWRPGSWSGTRRWLSG